MVRMPLSALRSSVRTTAWRGRNDVAHISRRRTNTAIAPNHLAQALTTLEGRGFQEVVTSPLRPEELHPFLDAGFTNREQLWLLRWRRPRAGAERAPTSAESGDANLALRTATTRRRRRHILDLDARSFDDFWRFDAAALTEVRQATRLCRVRVIEPTSGPGPISGYAAFGLTGTSGYLQRIAVDPHLRRLGLATRLIEDGLQWLTTYGAVSCLVNTQEANRSALKLYLSLGFEFEPQQLTVLSRDLIGKGEFEPLADGHAKGNGAVGDGTGQQSQVLR